MKILTVTRLLLATAIAVTPAVSVPLGGNSTVQSTNPRSLKDVGFFKFMKDGIEDLQTKYEGGQPKLLDYIVSMKLYLIPIGGKLVNMQKSPISTTYIEVHVPDDKVHPDRAGLTSYKRETQAWGKWDTFDDEHWYGFIPESPFTNEFFNHMTMDPLAAWKIAMDSKKLPDLASSSTKVREVGIWLHKKDGSLGYHFTCLGFGQGLWQFSVLLDKTVTIEVASPGDRSATS